MPIEIASNSAWSLVAIERYLAETALPCRLACVRPDDYPHVTSLWYLFRNGELWFSIQRSAKLASWLRSEPRCGFEIAVNDAPYAGVRGRGIARCAQASDDRILRALIDRFLGDENPKLATWLLSRTETEVTVSVTPQWLTSWDYSDRMS
jgi:nitroimidazol reductase NimA-like FMN-containing flavoprotein (pyridoxamine 5'-phosphate oxidase superfamily)